MDKIDSSFRKNELINVPFLLRLWRSNFMTWLNLLEGLFFIREQGVFKMFNHLLKVVAWYAWADISPQKTITEAGYFSVTSLAYPSRSGFILPPYSLLSYRLLTQPFLLTNLHKHSTNNERIEYFAFGPYLLCLMLSQRFGSHYHPLRFNTKILNNVVWCFLRFLQVVGIIKTIFTA